MSAQAARVRVVPERWLSQAGGATGADADFYRGKLQACRYFYAFDLPKTGAQAALLERLDPTTSDMRDAWF